MLDYWQDEAMPGFHIICFSGQLPQLEIVVHAGGGSFKGQMRKADKSGARLALILAESEIESDCITIKLLREQQPQEIIAQRDLSSRLQSLFNS